MLTSLRCDPRKPTRWDHSREEACGEFRPLFAGRGTKWSEKETGERDGRPYDEVRYYATLTVAPHARTVSTSPAPFATLPQAVDSFGGAVLGDRLYVYG